MRDENTTERSFFELVTLLLILVVVKGNKMELSQRSIYIVQMSIICVLPLPVVTSHTPKN